MKYRNAQAGTSLIESLIASALLLFVAVSVFPLFYRATANTASGSDSNRATHHSRSRLEGLLALPFDSQVFSMRDDKLPDHTISADGDGEKMTLGTRYWDDQWAADAKIDPKDPTHQIASPAWVADSSTAKGRVKWSRTSVIRYYSFADIGGGVIDINNPGQLVDEGHPQLFDRPLKGSAVESQVHFKEEEVLIESLRPGVSGFQVSLIRTN